MANIARRLGVSIRAILQKADMTPKVFADCLGYSERDMYKVIEGKVVLPPIEIERFSRVLGTTKSKLMSYIPDDKNPEFQYMKEFSNQDNLDRILDLMDEYVECKECV